MNEPLRTDGELLAEFADAGNESAFAELMARHGPMAYGVALRVQADHHDAQDVAQAAFYTLARKARSIRKDASVGGWLHRVAWCLAVDMKSSRASRQRREEATMHAQAKKAQDVAGEQGFREELDAALNQLPERYRQPLVLFHMEGHSLDATARMLGLKPGTVGSQLARAREMLRAKLMRRGVGVASVGALTTLLSAEAGASVLPASFVSATVKAAGLAAAGKLAAGVGTGVVSAKVAALTKGALNMLFWSSVKTVAVAASVVVVGGGVIVAQEMTQRKVDVKPVVSRQIRPDAAAATASLASRESRAAPWLRRAAQETAGITNAPVKVDIWRNILEAWAQLGNIEEFDAAWQACRQVYNAAGRNTIGLEAIRQHRLVPALVRNGRTNEAVKFCEDLPVDKRRGIELDLIAAQVERQAGQGDYAVARQTIRNAPEEIRNNVWLTLWERQLNRGDFAAARESRQAMPAALRNHCRLLQTVDAVLRGPDSSRPVGRRQGRRLGVGRPTAGTVGVRHGGDGDDQTGR